MQARCLLFEFQRRRYRAEAPAFGRNDFFNGLLSLARPSAPVAPLVAVGKVARIGRSRARTPDYALRAPPRFATDGSPRRNVPLARRINAEVHRRQPSL